MSRPVLEVRDLCVVSGDDGRVPRHQLRRRGGPGAVRPRGRGGREIPAPAVHRPRLPPGVGVHPAPGRRRHRGHERAAPPAAGPGPSSSSTRPPRPGCATDRAGHPDRDCCCRPGPGATAPVAGMRQRIQIAKALAHGADALLLDEPFVGVEHGVQSRILELLAPAAHRDRDGRGGGHPRPRGGPGRWPKRSWCSHDGEVVETGPAADVLESPRHHRTRSLVEDRRSA